MVDPRSARSLCPRSQVGGAILSEPGARSGLARKEEPARLKLKACLSLCVGALCALCLLWCRFLLARAATGRTYQYWYLPLWPRSRSDPWPADTCRRTCKTEAHTYETGNTAWPRVPWPGDSATRSDFGGCATDRACNHRPQLRVRSHGARAMWYDWGHTDGVRQRRPAKIVRVFRLLKFKQWNSMNAVTRAGFWDMAPQR